MPRLYLFALVCMQCCGCTTGLLWSTRSSTQPRHLIGAEAASSASSIFLQLRYSDDALHTLALQTDTWQLTSLDDDDPDTPRPLASAAGHARSELPAGRFRVQLAKDGSLLVLAEGEEPRQIYLPARRSSPALQVLATPFSVAMDVATFPLQMTVGLGILFYFVLS